MNTGMQNDTEFQTSNCWSSNVLDSVAGLVNISSICHACFAERLVGSRHHHHDRSGASKGLCRRQGHAINCRSKLELICLIALSCCPRSCHKIAPALQAGTPVIICCQCRKSFISVNKIYGTFKSPLWCRGTWSINEALQQIKVMCCLSLALRAELQCAFATKVYLFSYFTGSSLRNWLCSSLPGCANSSKPSTSTACS